MKNTHKILFLFLVLAAVPGISNAQIFRDVSKVGTTVAQFLKIGAGARAAGMGNAYAAVSDDIYSAYWNPAGIAVSEGTGQAAFNHVNWLADINYDYAAASMNVDGMGSMFFTLTSLRVPEDKVRTFDYPDGDGRMWDANYLAIGLGFARSLTDRFSIGVQAKYIKESIWDCSSNGFALDIGTYYVTPFNNLVIGAAVSNFGGKMTLDGRNIQFNSDPNDDQKSGANNIPSQYSMESFDLPLSFRLGLAMDLLNTRYIRLKAAVDAVHPNDNNEYLNLGGELAYNNLLFLRGGYRALFLNDSEGGLTLGGGINYEVSPGLRLKLSYAYENYGRLKDVQYFDVSIVY